MPSTDFDPENIEAGQRGMEIKRRLREKLESQGMSREGFKELIGHQPLASANDRRVAYTFLIKALRDQVVAEIDAGQTPVADGTAARA